MTHAFFKALLFLGAGSVIHATHTQDLHEMGGLCEEDAVDDGDLGARRALARRHPAARRLLEQGRDPARRLHTSTTTSSSSSRILTAALTAFYMGRATFLAFFVEAGAALQERRTRTSPRGS